MRVETSRWKLYNCKKIYKKKYNLGTSHFTGQKTNIGNRLNKHNEKNVYEYLTKDYYVTSSNLKKKIFDNNIKEYKCECCGITEWKGLPISLQLHHINGDNTDNRLDNLQILCPNCHSQTDNFCGKNYHSKKEIKYCEKCGAELKYKNSRLCPKCSHKENALLKRKVERSSKEELFKMIKEMSFESIGRKYDVSGKAITKWCKYYGIPHRKCDLQKKWEIIIDGNSGRLLSYFVP